LFVLTFFVLILENPNEAPASNKWQSPFHSVGALMLMHLNNSLGPRWMSFYGMDLILVTLIAIALQRKFTKSNIDRAGQTPTPKPLVQLAFVSFAGTAFVWISGLLRGGEVSWSLWQVDRVVYLPVVFLLFQAGLRGPKDHAILARILCSAALLRAVMAILVANTFSVPPDPYTGDTRLPYATTHQDSVLFSDACVVLISLVSERAGGWAWRRALIALPILFAGMVANNRRLVWVQVAIVFLTTYLATPPNPFKRKLKRAVLILSPAIAVYLGAGWDSKAPVFKPAQMVRSVVDPATDSSSLWRELENYDLVFTIRQNPILGTGYGHQFSEVLVLPDVDYPLEKYCPHNSLLGLWAYAGYVGFTAMTLLWVVGVYFGLRAYHLAQRPVDRAAAMTSFGAVCVYLVQCFGDIGLGGFTGIFTVAPALAVAGKLAVATGGWGAKKLGPATPSSPPPNADLVDVHAIGQRQTS
jgi:hypothetical protein